MDAETLYQLLPAIYRVRDAAAGEPLKALLSVLAEQMAAVEENLAQLYDDQFIETAAPWVVPYIGDLIGYRPLHAEAGVLGSPRAEVAHTIGYRRRKGTAAMLEQLARDVTGWDAAVVEFFRLLATTQYLNHIRPDNLYGPDLRRGEALAALDTPFDVTPHTADVRHIGRRRGKYNIPNVGLILWRIAEQALTRSPAHVVDPARFTFHPLGLAAPLYTDAAPPEAAPPEAASKAPLPISRRALARHKDAYYGPGLSFVIELAPAAPDGQIDPSAAPVPVPLAAIIACDLSDAAATWAHTPVPAGKVAVDPVLGRIAFAEAPAGVVLVSYHYGFSAEMGGGEYERPPGRDVAPDGTPQPVTAVAMPGAIGDALPAGSGIVEIQDSGRYEETLGIVVAAGARVELRGRNGARPALVLGGELSISGGAGSELILSGLLIAGGTLRVTGELSRLRLEHCTLAPGLGFDPAGQPLDPAAASLVVESAGTAVEIESCIVGPLRLHEAARAGIRNSIVDALADDGLAYAGPGEGRGGELTAENSTFVGRVHARKLPLAANTIFLARLPDGAPPQQHPVHVDQRQAGCVRFSYVPPGSRTPRRHKCLPDAAASAAEAARVRPLFTSLRYGDAGYGQLSLRCAPEIRTGADDGSEMGAFHDLFAPQREINLRVRLDEYLRFGLEAGIFYAS